MENMNNGSAGVLPAYSALTVALLRVYKGESSRLADKEPSVDRITFRLCLNYLLTTSAGSKHTRALLELEPPRRLRSPWES